MTMPAAFPRESASARRRLWNMAPGTIFIALIPLNWVLEAHLASPAVRTASLVLTVVIALVMLVNVPTGRRMFILLAIALTATAALTLDNWQAEVTSALALATFTIGFFAALASLGETARQSPAIRRCGIYLANRPPGRRYGALTVGGILFSLLLNFGSIFLLGSLATASAEAEPDPEIRELRKKRMLLAVERAMGSSLTWSPLAHSVTMSTLLIPGASWANMVIPSMFGAAIVALTGWAMDTWFRRRPKGPPRVAPPVAPGTYGSARDMLPLVLLLAIMASATMTIHLTTGIRIPGVVTFVVPLVALCWAAVQVRGPATVRETVRRVGDFMTNRLPSMQPEVVLISASAYIGLLGGKILSPILLAAGLDLTAVPTPALMIGIIVVIAVAGQLAMNPFLITILLIPLLPSPAELGITPTALAMTLCAGWTINALTSPFTAMAVIVARLAQVSPFTVGVRWNGVYTLVFGSLLTGWVLLYAALTS